MKKYLLPESGNFYKVNMHNHTTLSDGEHTPEQIKEFYKDMGYSAVAFTDHGKIWDVSHLTDDEFVAISSYEYDMLNPNTIIDLDEYGVADHFHLHEAIHINFYAKDSTNLKMPCVNPNTKRYQSIVDDPKVEIVSTLENGKFDVETLNHVIAEHKKLGYLAVYNHPAWSLNNYELYANLKGFDGLELVNGATYRSSDQEYVPLVFDQILRQGERVVPVGGDDGHHPHHYGLAWTMVKADKLSYDSIIEGIEKGNCYMSTGPEIKEISIEGNKVTVKTSEAAGIIYTVMGRSHQYKIMEKGEEPVTEATFTIMPHHVYFRITVRDTNGRRANSRAYWLDELDIDFDA